MTSARDVPRSDQVIEPGRPRLLLVSSLLGSSLVGRLPQAMSALALVRIVLDGGGDYATAGALTASYVIASTAGAPLLSRAIDVTGRARAVLLFSSLVAAGGFVGVVLTVGDAMWAAALFTVLAGFFAPPLEPTLRGLWPRLADEGRELQRVFAADAAVQEVLFILGPLVTAVAAAALGPAGAVYAMALFTVVGTALFSLHRVVGKQPARPRNAHRHHSAIRDRTVQMLVVVLVAAGLPIGVLTITATRLGAINGDDALAGWGLAVNAVGALAGAVWIARARSVPEPSRALPVFLLLLAVLYLPTALLSVPPVVWLVLAGISGLALPPTLTQVFALIAQRVPSEVATEANAWIISAFNVGIGAGTFLAATATGAWGTDGIMVAVVAASGVASVGSLVAARAARRGRG